METMKAQVLEDMYTKTNVEIVHDSWALYSSFLSSW